MSAVIEPPDTRTREITLIHVAKARLKMTEDEYRAMLRAVGRAESAKDLDHAGRKRVIEYLKGIGFKPNKAKKRRPTPAAFKVDMCKKVRALLIDGGHRSDEYADAMARHMFGVDRFEWLEEVHLHKLVAALMVDQQRRLGRLHGQIRALTRAAGLEGDEYANALAARLFPSGAALRQWDRLDAPALTRLLAALKNDLQRKGMLTP